MRPHFRDYGEVLSYINRCTNYERDASRYTSRHYNLRTMEALLQALGRPHTRYPVLHVAGTKGKGSVCLLLDAALRGKGYRTGLYTSPHLMDMLERIQLNGRPVSRRDFTRAVNAMAPALDRLRPTYFELMTAAAFYLFAEAAVDYAVVEVGLGGRLDSTNVVQPAVAVINTVDYDHMDKLGRTLRKIAFEKAGIIKRRLPCVAGPQSPEVLEVIRRTADRVEAPLRVFGEDFRVRRVSVDAARRRMSCRVQGTWGEASVTLPFAGLHQARNAAVAAETLAQIGELDAGALRGMSRVEFPGRFQILRGRPQIVVDVAHNPVSVRALVGSLDLLVPRRVVLVFGAARDKDYRSMLQTLAPSCDAFVFTRARSPRAVEPAELAGLIPDRPYRQVWVTGDVGQALVRARAMAGPRDTVLVTGSFYVVGEALAWLRRAGKIRS